MKCPKCGADNDKVIDTRPSDEGRAIRRRRVCIECEYRYSTTERAEVLGMKVIKKDGTRQDFSREKLMAGLASACSKRPVSSEQMNSIATEITDMVNNNFKREISSTAIGEHIMERLRKLDKVAYVRFASVYKDFTDPKLFAEEVDKISSKDESAE